MAITLDFGKHQGKTLEWILFHDPGYIRYILEKGIDKQLPLTIRSRFYDLGKKAHHLKVPGGCHFCRTKPITRMLLVKHISGGLGGVVFCCDLCEPFEKPLSEPLIPSFFQGDYFRDYDKTGNTILVRSIKNAYFGDPSTKLNQQRMDQFFENTNNFILGQELIRKIPTPSLFETIEEHCF